MEGSFFDIGGAEGKDGTGVSGFLGGGGTEAQLRRCNPDSLDLFFAYYTISKGSRQLCFLWS
jgi:hypothetical protein